MELTSRDVAKAPLADLVAADQVTDARHDLLLHQALQRPRAVLHVGALLHQPGLGLGGDLKEEGLGAAQAAVVELGEPDVQDLVEVGAHGLGTHVGGEHDDGLAEVHFLVVAQHTTPSSSIPSSR